MPKTVSIFQVGELNRVLEDCGLGYRVHLHDLCGGRAFLLRSFQAALMTLMLYMRSCPSFSGVSERP